MPLPPLANRYLGRPDDQAQVEANWQAWERRRGDAPRWTPYRVTDDSIARERDRFDRARVLVERGSVDEARRLCWWPRDESFPKDHWSRRPVSHCSCGKRTPNGIYALCAYCGGATSETPSLIPRGRS